MSFQIWFLAISDGSRIQNSDEPENNHFISHFLITSHLHLQDYGKAGKVKMKQNTGRCTIITTEASKSVKPTHHRMPFILKPDFYSSWLDTKNHDTAEIQNIFQTGMVTELSFRPISQKVNFVRHNGPGNIE